MIFLNARTEKFSQINSSQNKTIAHFFKFLPLIAMMLVSLNGWGQTTIAVQDFDSGNSWSYSSDVTYFSHKGSNTNNNVYPASDGWSDDGFYGIISLTDANGLDYSNLNGNLLGERDLDDEGDFGTSGDATTTFSSVDVSSYTSVEITFDYDIKGYNANSDEAFYEIFHDGTGQGRVTLQTGSTAGDDAQGSETISVPDAVNNVKLEIIVNNNGASGYSGFDNFKVTGTASGPTISLSESSLSGFTYTKCYGPSDEQSFNVEGSNLTNDITLTAPTNYEISETSGSGFGNSITLSHSGGTVSSKTIYVRLKALLTIGDYNSENISATSSGASSQNITCDGSVVAAGGGGGSTTTIDFETAGSGYTPSTTDGSGDKDVFNRSNPNIGGNSTYIWAVEDLAVTDPDLTLDQISISGATSFTFSIDFLTPNSEDWDVADELLITYSIDGGTSQNLMWVQSNPDGDPYNAPAALDLNFDGDGDDGEELPAISDDFGAGVGSVFQTFTTSSISLSGNNTLDIKFQFNGLTSAAEGIYIDNVIIETIGGSAPSPILISEIMVDPSKVTDANGEWFEIFNLSNCDVDINGYQFSDNGTESFTIGSSLIVPANGFIVLGSNSSSSSNGGYNPDYTYSGYTLDDNGDEIIVSDGSKGELDRVEYDNTDWPVNSGQAMVFTQSPDNDNNDYANWTPATDTYGDGDLGSPGSNGTDNSTLPIHLLTFTGSGQDGYNLLQWATASEENNDYFTLEKSTNGKDFQALKTIEGAGNSNDILNYSTKDYSVDNTLTYYRLKQTDFDGKYTYSDIISVQSGEAEDEMQINVIQDAGHISLNLQNLARGQVILELYDLQGRRISQTKKQAADSFMHIKLNTDHPQGMYLLRVINDRQVESRKLVF